MAEIMGAEFRRQLEEKGFTILQEGRQRLPASKGLTVALKDCRAIGAEMRQIPLVKEVEVGTSDGGCRTIWRTETQNFGNNLFAVFDTIVERKGHVGHLAFQFTQWDDGQLWTEKESVAIGPFPDSN